MGITFFEYYEKLKNIYIVIRIQSPRPDFNSRKTALESQYKAF